MIIELMVWCADRKHFIDGMVTYGFASLDADGNLVPIPNVAIDEIGPITKTPGVYDEKGQEIEPPVVIEGHHVNIRVWGDFAKMVTAGRPAEGTIFERTNVLGMIPGLKWEPLKDDGVPAGYMGPMGVKLFDPASVNSPSRVWA